MKSCPKCGGSMERKGKGTDHNLRVENRSVLKATHEKRLVAQATRPLMYICEKCGYIEFYVPAGFGRAMKKEGKGDRGTRPAPDNHQYFT